MVFTLVVHLHVKDDPQAVQGLSQKLVEAAETYRKDPETLSWFVMQDPKDNRSFTIVERYERESSLKIHTQNPFYKTFGEYVRPLLDRPMELKAFHELDSGKL